MQNNSKIQDVVNNNLMLDTNLGKGKEDIQTKPLCGLWVDTLQLRFGDDVNNTIYELEKESLHLLIFMFYNNGNSNS